LRKEPKEKKSQQGQGRDTVRSLVVMGRAEIVLGRERDQQAHHIIVLSDLETLRWAVPRCHIGTSEVADLPGTLENARLRNRQGASFPRSPYH
jgi:hypothetical protein